MDVVKAVETYITKMVSTPSSMKVLLLDTHTVRLVCFMTPRVKLRCSRLDTNRLAVSDTIHAPLAPSIPHGQDRQQEAGAHGAHEMHMLPATERG